MMKYVVALVVLLHLCSSLETNKTLITEIRSRLVKLDELYKNHKVNFTSPETVHVPSKIMYNNAATCFNVFTRELKSLLGNMTIDEDSKPTYQELKTNVEALKLHPKNDNICVMDNSKSLNPIKLYAHFLRKLNSKKR